MADNEESKEGEKTVVIKESKEDAAPPEEQDEGKAAAAVTSENTAGPSRRMSVTPRDGKVHEMKGDRGGCKFRLGKHRFGMFNYPARPAVNHWF